ncbi:YadA-like family protein [Veillonella sp.]|uniref:YadA-like family protein n=4 Tax=unclassified Veillonella TaxID=2630086 RepID=UPI00399F8A4F
MDLGTDGSVVVGDTKLDKSGLEIVGGPSVTKDGIDAGGKVVGNLGEGAVAAGSTDAVTGGQLFGVQKDLKDSIKGAQDTANSALQTVSVKDGAGNVLTVNKDNAGFGIVGATDGMVESKVSGQDLVVDLTAATKEKINNAAGIDLGNLDDKGKTVIKEVVQESVDVAGGNNIEVANATNEAGVKTFTVNMKNNVDLGANGSIKAGNTTLDASGLTAGATKVGADGVSVGSTAVTADGVSVGDAALTADGLAIVGGPSVTKDGINAGGKVIGNLGEGAVAAGSKDAVTGGQLFGVQKDLNDSIKGAQDTANSALQTVSVKDGAGNVLIVNKDNAGFGIVGATDGMVESKVSGQDLVVDLTAATKEKINNAAGKDLGNLDDKGKTVIKEVVQNAVDVKGGTNINVDAANVNDVKTFTVNLDKNLDLGGEGSITLGDTIIKSGDVHVGGTTINNGGVTLNSNGEFKVGDTVINGSTINVGGTTLNQGGLSIKNGPTINVGGINMGGTKITNVANATEEGDVVTYNQLQEVKNIATEGSELANSALQTVAVKGNDGQTITISKGQANLGIVGATDGMVESKVSGQDLVVDLTAATKEKINNAAGKDLGNLDDKGKTVIKEVIQESVDVDGGNNIEVAKATNEAGVKTFTVNMKNNVDLGANGSIKAGATKVGADGVSVGDAALTTDGLAIVGGPSVTKDGINAGGKVVSNLGEGSVAEGSKDAVTGGQLFAVKTDVDGVKGRVDTINNNLEKVTNNLEKVTETAGSALQTVTVTDTKGQTLVVDKDHAGFGIKGATDGMVTSEVSGQDLVVDLTAATKEKINNAAGKDLGNLDDKGKTVIKEVVQNAVDVKGGTNINVDTADVNDVKTFTVNLNKNVDLGADGSISLGGTTINQGGLTINNGPSVTVDGINANNTKITNVVDGSKAGDVVTYNQLLEVRKIAENSSGTSGSALQSVSVKDTEGNTIVLSKDNSSLGIVGATDGMVESKVNGNDLVVDLTAATKEKINNAAGKDLGNLDDKGKEVIKEVVQKSVDVKGGTNIEVASETGADDVKTFTVNMKNNVDLGATGSIKAGTTTVSADGVTAGETKLNESGLEVGETAVTADGVNVGNAALTTDGLAIVGGPSVTKDGINAGGKVVSNLGEGSVAEGSKDAVTGGQLFAVKTDVDGVKGRVDTINNNLEKVTNNLEKVTETAGSALQTVTVTDTKGQTLVVDKDNAGFGIKGATDGMVTSEVSGRDLVVDLTAATKEKINNAAGKDLGNLDDKGKEVIKEVVQKSVDVKGGTNIEVASETGADDVKTFTVNMKNNVDLGATGSIKAGTTTVDANGLTAGTTTVSADGVTAGETKLNESGLEVGDTAVTADGVSVGDATLTANGLAIVGGPSVTKDGINAGGKVVSNLGEGSVAEGSKDAVTGGQLFAVKTDVDGVKGRVDTINNNLEKVTNNLEKVTETAGNALQTVTVTDTKGQTLVVDKDHAGFGIKGTTDGMVTSEVSGQDLVVDLTAATKEKINNAAGKDLGNLDDKGKEVVQKSVDVKGGANIEVTSETGADDVKTFTVNLNKTVDLGADGSISLGNTVINGNTINIGGTTLNEGGLTIKNGPSINVGGINAGGTRITNVADGKDASDVVTYSQLQEVRTIAENGSGTSGTALQTVSVKDTDGNAITVNKEKASFGIVAATDGMVESKVSGQDLVVDLTAATKEKINNAAGKDLGNLDDKGKEVIKEVVQKSVDVKGGTNIEVASETGADDVKTFTVNMKNNVDLGATGSIKAGTTTVSADGVTAGETKLNKSGLEVGETTVTADGVSVGNAALTTDGLAIVGGPSVTKDGINAGGKVVSNLGEGSVAEGSKDAVTGGQLFAVKTDVDGVKGRVDTINNNLEKVTNNLEKVTETAGNALQTVTVTDTKGQTLVVDKDHAGFGIKGATDGMVTSEVSGQDVVVDLTTATKEKINNAAGKDLGNLDDKGKEVIKEVVQKSVDVKGGTNIEVTSATGADDVKTFTVNMKNNVDLGADGSIKAGATTVDANGLAIADGPSVTKDGIDAGGKVVSNLGEGSVSEGSTDAVTGGQLYGVKTELDGKVNTVTNEVNTIKTDVGTLKTEVTTVKNDVGTLKTEVNTVKTDVGTIRTDVNTLTDRVTTVENTAGSVLQTVTVTDTNGQKLVVNKENSGFGIKGATDGMVTSEVSGRDLVVDLTAATKEKINNAAGKDLGNLDDKGKTVIKEVVQDAVDVKGGSNINVDKATVDGVKTFTVNLDKNLDLGGKGSITLGDTIIKSGDVQVGGTTINNGGVTLNSNGEFKVGDTVINGNTINVGGTTLNQGGLTIKNGPSINVGGINMGGTKITNVANATEAGDVVTYNQLQEVKNIATEGSELASSALQTVSVKGNDGQVITISKGQASLGIVGAADGMVESKVNGNDLVVDLTTATKEKINNAAGKDLGNLDDKGKEVIKEVSQDAVDVVGGNNITVDTEKADDVKTFTVNLNKDLNLGGEGSITLGDTVIKSGDLHVGGTTINNGGVTLVPTGEFRVGDTVINGGSINVAGTTINEGGITVNPQGNIVLGDTTISNGGFTIKNGPTINVGGINMGGTKITNVANGTQEGDVVTYNQLQEVKNIATEGSELANSALQTISINDGNGGVITVNKGQAGFGVTGKSGGMVESKVDGQNLVVDLTAATKEKINNAADKDLSNLSDKGKEVIKETSQNAVNVTGGTNITVTPSDVNGVKTFDVNLNNQIDLGTTGSVKAGNTTVDNNGVSVGSSTLNGEGLAITGGPSVTKDGIDAGNKVISNIADGVKAGDAVNKGQLDKVDTKVTDLTGRVDGLDKGLKDLGTKVDGLGQEVKDLGTKVGDLDTKVGNLDTKVGNLDTKVTDLDKTVKGFDGRITDVEKLAGRAMQGITIGTDTNNEDEHVNLTKDNSRMDIVGATDEKGNKSIVTAVEGNKVTVDLTDTVKTKIDNAATKNMDNLTSEGKANVRKLVQAVGGDEYVSVKTIMNPDGSKTFNISMTKEAVEEFTRETGWYHPEDDETVNTVETEKSGFRNATTNTSTKPKRSGLKYTENFKIADGEKLELNDDLHVGHSLTIGEVNGQDRDASQGGVAEITAQGFHVGESSLTGNSLTIGGVNDSSVAQLTKAALTFGDVTDGTVTASTTLSKDGLAVGDTSVTSEKVAVGKSSLTSDTLTVDGIKLASQSTTERGLITLDNVAQGSITESSNQAITGAQLYPIKTQVETNTAAIGVLGEVVNAQGQAIQGLSSEIQNVRNESAEGDAMAASLAALNPLPYAEGERGQIMAGLGTYRGKQALAVGYAYAPDSDQQYTVGLSYGQGGKAMANLGATFRIGSGETTKPGTSVAAVQNKVQALEAQNKAQQAKFDAELAAKQNQIDAQNDRIAKLEALVQQLVQK